MPRRVAIFVLLPILALLSLQSKAFSSEPPFERGVLIAEFFRACDEDEVGRFCKEKGLRKGRVLRSGRRYELRLPTGADESAWEARLKKDSRVTRCAKNYYATPLATTPNDPDFSLQWGLTAVKAPEGWDFERGSVAITTIAVIDTGFDMTHPDLQANYAAGFDFDNNDSDPSPDPADPIRIANHGTAVAGVAAAVTNNSLGIAGVSWGSKIMPLRARSNIAVGLALDHAAALKVAVVNMSFKFENLSVDARNMFLADLSSAAASGVILVAGAGNDGANLDGIDVLPVNAPGVLGVGAVDKNDQRAVWSVTPKQESNYGTTVDVMAPGSDIRTTFWNGGTHGFGSSSGTSVAAPFVSGLAALLVAQNPAVSTTTIVGWIETLTDDLGATGKDVFYGNGRINLLKALETIPPAVTLTQPTSGVVLTGSAATLSGTASDLPVGGSGLALVEFSIRRNSDQFYWTGSTWVSVQTWNATTLTGSTWTATWSLPIDDGVDQYFLHARGTDRKGNVTAVSSQPVVAVRVDNVPPSGTFVINPGNPMYTTTPAVTLVITSSGATQMRFTNLGADLTAVSFGSVSTTLPQGLSSGDGVKTVIGELKDAAGNISSQMSDTITLDTLAPAVVSRAPSPGKTGISPVAPGIALGLFDAVGVDSATVSTATAQLVDALGGPVSVSVAFATATATIFVTPTATLAESTFYTIRFSTGIRDVAGNPFAGDSWSFQTAGIGASAWPMIAHDRFHTGRSTETGPAAVRQKWATNVSLSSRYQLSISTDGRTLYAHVTDGPFSESRIQAFDTETGQTRWVQVGFIPQSFDGGTPAVGADGTIYGVSNSVIRAIRPDGTTFWERDLGGPIRSSPAIGPDGTIYLGVNTTPDRRLVALAPDGTERWRVALPDTGIFSTASSPAIGTDGSIYVTSSQTVVAVSPLGVERWRRTLSGNVSVHPVILSDGRVVIADDGGRLSLLDPTSGTILGVVGPVGSSLGAPVVASDGQLYVAKAQEILRVSPSGLSFTSIFQETSEIRIDGQGGLILSADAGGKLFVAGIDRLAAMTTAGVVLWTAEVPGQYAAPILAGGRLYLATNRNVVYAFEPSPVSTMTVSGSPDLQVPNHTSIITASVRDALGNPVSNAEVRFAVTGGGGVLNATRLTTLSDGTTAATLILGPLAGANTVLVSVRSSAGGMLESAVTVTGMSLAVTLTASTTQAAVSQAVPLIATVRSGSALVAGVNMTFSVLGGGGSLSSTATVTDSAGQARTTLTTGSSPGINTVRVVAESGPFNEASVTATFPATPLGGVWSLHHGDPQRTGTAASVGPSTTTVLWRLTIGNPQGESIGLSDPVVAPDGTVHVGVQGTSSGLTTFYAIDPAAGTVRWTHPAQGDAAVGSDGTVYLANSGGITALNANGAVRWQLPSAPGVRPVIGPDGTIYVAGGNATGVKAVSPGGAIRWTYGTTGNVYTGVTLNSDGSRLFFSEVAFVSPGFVTFVHAVSTAGVQIWKSTGLTSGAFDASVVFKAPNTLFVVTDNLAYALDAVTGTILWTHEEGVGCAPSPALSPDGSRLYAVFDGLLVALDTATGTTIWQNFYARSIECPRAAPIVDRAGTIYLVSRSDHSLRALNADGTSRWKFSVPENEFIFPTPAIAPGTLYVGSQEGFLYAIQATSATQLLATASPDELTVGQSAQIRVTALNASSQPVAGVPLTFTVLGGGGTVSPGSVVTDVNGLGTATLSNPTLGANLVQATAAGVSTGTVTITAFSPGIAASDWPVFQGSAGLSGRTSLAAPTTPQAAWTLELGGGVIPLGLALTPTGRLMVTTDLTTPSLRAVENGVEIWRATLPSGSHTASPPAVAKDGATFLGSDGGFSAFNSDGSLRWFVPNVHGPAVIGGDGTIYAPVSLGVAGVPGAGVGGVAALTAGGQRLWQTALQSDSFPPAVAQGVNLVYTRDKDGRVYGLSSMSGAIQWTATVPDFVSIVQGQLAAITGPVVSDAGGVEQVYLAGNSGRVYAYSNSGRLLWETPTFPSPSGPVSIQPAVGRDGSVYVVTQNGFLIALSSAGVVRWRTTVGANGSAPPVVTGDGTILVPLRNSQLVAVSPTGVILWTRQIGPAVQGVGVGPLAVGSQGRVYVMGDSGRLEALQPTAGSVGSDAMVEFSLAGAAISTTAAPSTATRVLLTSNLQAVTSFYDVTGSFGTSGSLAFKFDPALVAPGNTVDIYRYDTVQSTWVRQFGTVSSGGNAVLLTTGTFASLYAILTVDQTPPAPITDLTARVGPDEGQVRLTWTAPGDDGAVGTAATYELRRAEAPITEQNFSLQIVVSGLPAPRTAGTKEQMLVGSLTPGSTYYFAMKSRDDQGNVSGLDSRAANGLPATTWAQRDSTAPATITDLAITARTAGSLSVTWTAPGDDGTVGRATGYLLRFGTFSLTSATFASGTLAAIPTPGSSGQREQAVVAGLTPATTYYVAVVAEDNAGNQSDVSVSTAAMTYRRLVSDDGGLVLEISTGGVIISTVPIVDNKATSALDRAAASGETIASAFYRLGPAGLGFADPALVTIALSTAQPSVIAGAPPRLMRYDIAGDIWVPLSGFATGPATVSGRVNPPVTQDILSILVPDQVAPGVELLRPVAAAVVSGTVSVQANVWDNGRVNSVDLRVDGTSRQSTAAGMILREEFDQPGPSPPAGWVIEAGTWSVVSGVFRGEIPAGAEAVAVHGTAISDAVLEAAVEGRGAGTTISLLFGYQDRQNLYALDLVGNQARIRRRVNGSDVILASQGFPGLAVAGDWHRVRVVRSGSRIRAYLDELILPEVTDSTFSSGRLGWQVTPTGGLPGVGQFDQLRATRYDLTWDTRDTADGTRVVEVRGHDTNGVVTSQAVSVQVDNTPPAAITSLTALPGANELVRLSWVAPGDDGTLGTVVGYQVRAATFGVTGLSPEAWWAQASTVPVLLESSLVVAGQTQGALVGPFPLEVEQVLGVRAVDRAGSLGPLDTALASSAPVRSIPGGLLAPNSFVAEVLSSTTVRFTWQDRSQVEEVYGVFAVPMIPEFEGTFPLPANSTSTVVTGLLPNIRLSFYEAQCRKAGVGIGRSNSLGENAPFTFAAVPVGLRPSSQTATSVVLTWQDGAPSSPATRYRLERSTDGGASFVTLQTFQTGLTTTTFVDTGLVTQTIYTYRVRAFNGDGVLTAPSLHLVLGDQTAPVTRLVLVGDAVQVVAEDPADALFVSGVATTTVVLDNGPGQVVTTPFVVPAGTRFITVQSMDRAGNQEVAHRHVAFPVTGLRATAGAQAVHLLWRDPTSAGDFLGDTQEYDVERATDVGGRPGSFVVQFPTGDVLSLPRWADRSLTSGATYWYRILTRRNDLTGGTFQGTFTSIPSAPVRAGLSADQTPPGVEGITIQPTLLSGPTDLAAIAFRLTEAATWQITVLDGGGAVVRTLVSRGFTDDFGDGQDDGWAAPLGVWVVDEGGYQGYARGAGVDREEFAVTTVDHFQDLVFETTITFHPQAIPPNGLGPIFRVQGDPLPSLGIGRTYYAFELDAIDPAVRGSNQFTAFRKFVDGRSVPLTIVRSSAPVLVGGRVYAVRVEATSGTLRGFIDGVLVAEAVDPVPLGFGRVGLRIGAEEAPGAGTFGPVRVLAAGSTLAWDGLTDAGHTANDGRYTVSLAAADVFGNTTRRELGSVLMDRQPPTAVTDLVATSQVGGAIRLAWSAATDAGSGVASYRVLRATDAAAVGSVGFLVSVASPGYVDGPVGLMHDTTYYYLIQAMDAGGHVQAVGNLVAGAQSDQIPPAEVTDLVARFRGPNVGDLTLTWTSPGDDGLVGRLHGLVEIHLSSALPVASDVVAFSTDVAPGTPMVLVVTGLAEGVTHYVAVRTLDEVGNAAALSAPVSVRYVVARSTDGVATLISDQSALRPVVVDAATTASLGQVALSTGLVLVGAVYDIQPDTAPFSPPLVVTLVYSTPLPTGVVESDLKIYQFNSSSGVWVTVPDQTLDAVNRRVIGRIVTLTSMVAIFGIDRVPPTARLLAPDPAAAGAGLVVKGTLAVVGSVVDDRRLASWRVEVATGVNAMGGFTTILMGTAPVDGAGLGTWNTALMFGWVTLRLTAVDTAGNTASTAAAVFVGDPALAQTLGPAVPELVEDGKPGRLEHPEAVALGPDGTRWVADTGEDRVFAYGADGRLRMVISALDKEVRVASGVTVASVRLEEPGGLSALADGGIAVADTGQSRLVVLSSTGGVRLVVGRVSKKGEPQPGGGLGEFNHPRGVAVDEPGNVYVADTENHRWQVLSATGTPLLSVLLPPAPTMDDGDDTNGKETGEMAAAEPVGIARERGGTRVYVSDRVSGQVFVYMIDLATSPARATLTGTLGGGAGTFKAPWHLAGTSRGHLYVAERNANRVRAFDRFGAEVLVFGVGPDQVMDPAAPLRFNKPTGVGVGPGGELAVASRNDDRVKLYEAPSVTPMASSLPAPKAAPPRPSGDLSALGPPHDFALGPNPARAGAPVNVYFVTGWSNFETEVRVYTAVGEPVSTAGGAGPADGGAIARALPWGSPAYAPGRYAVSWAPRQDSGEPLASGVYLIQVKVRNPDTGEVVPTLKKVVVIR